MKKLVHVDGRCGVGLAVPGARCALVIRNLHFGLKSLLSCISFLEEPHLWTHMMPHPHSKLPLFFYKREFRVTIVVVV